MSENLSLLGASRRGRRSECRHTERNCVANFQFALQQLHPLYLFAGACFIAVHVMVLLTMSSDGAWGGSGGHRQPGGASTAGPHASQNDSTGGTTASASSALQSANHLELLEHIITSSASHFILITFSLYSFFCLAISALFHNGGVSGLHALLRLIICTIELAWYGAVAGPAALFTRQIDQATSPSSAAVLEYAFVAVVAMCAFIDLQRVFDGLVGVKPLTLQTGHLIHFRSGEQRRAPRRRDGRRHIEGATSEDSANEERLAGAADAAEAVDDVRTWRKNAAVSVSRRAGSSGRPNYGAIRERDATGQDAQRPSSPAPPSVTSSASGSASRRFTLTFPSEDEQGVLSTYTYSWLNLFMSFGTRRPKQICSRSVPKLPHIHNALANIYRPLTLLWDEASERGRASAEATETSGWASRVRHVLFKCCTALFHGCLQVLRGMRWAFQRLCGSPPERTATLPGAGGNDANASLPAPGPSLAWTFLVLSAAGRRFLYIVPLKLVQDTLALCGPLVVGWLIQYIKNPEIDVDSGLRILALFIAILTGQSLFFQAYLKHLYAVSMDCATACRSLVLEKSLRAPQAALLGCGFSEGTIVSLSTVDAARVADTLIFLHNVWGHPLIVMISLAVLQHFVGWPAALASLATLCVLIPVNRISANQLKDAQSRVIKTTNMRVNIINESLNVMRTIKSNGWERSTLRRILGVRTEEFKGEGAVVDAEARNAFQTEASIAAIATVCFATYYFTGGALEAERLIPALAALNQLRFPVWSLPGLLSTLSRGLVSLRRIEEFLHIPETRHVMMDDSVAPGTVALVGEGFYFATFSRRRAGEPKTNDESAPSVLRNICLAICPGTLTVFHGKVGCGKSALLYAMLGEMDLTGAARCLGGESSRNQSFASRASGAGADDPEQALQQQSARRPWPPNDFEPPLARPLIGSRLGGTVAYCGETPYLRNETIRMNICMDLAFEDDWYREVLQACALDADLAELPEGDMTIVGDRGVQLSGGQKARVALARACYAFSDIYLLDGVLSALDGSIACHIVTNVIHGLLAGKTRIITGHSHLSLLEADRVFEITGGQLVEAAVPSNACKAAVPTPVRSRASSPVTKEPPSKWAKAEEPRSRVPLTVMREHRLGKATRATKLAYTVYLSGFGWTAIAVFLIACVAQALQTGMDVWLGMWIGRRITTGVGFLFIYSGLGLCAATFSLIRAKLFFRSCFSSATALHNRVVTRLLGAPMSYFDVVPTGIASSALSKDQDVVDRAVPESIDLLLSSSLRLIAICAFNSVLSPVFLLILPFMAVLFWRISAHYLAVSAEVRRLENRSQSNNVALLKEAVHGAVTVRAMQLNGMVEEEFCRALDVSNAAIHVSNMLSRWVGLRLEMVSIVLVASAAFTAVTFRADVSPAFAGVAVVNCLNTSRILLMLCRRIGMFQNQFTSAEQVARLLVTVPLESRYGNNTEALEMAVQGDRSAATADEGREEANDDDDDAVEEYAPELIRVSIGQGEHFLASSPPVAQDLLSAAPLSGQPAVEFIGVSARYRATTPLIMRNATFTIPAGAKVGITGRTGAGKSTVFNVLLRLVDFIEGTIRVWGEDTAQVSKQRLRKELAVIPQDAMLLKGTWRFNLDPEGRGIDDAAMWSALDQVYLADKLRAAPGSHGLETAIAEGGANMSIGERQLLCLARTLLRGSRILLMDEVSANIDLRTDELIQQTIRSAFCDCTVITIAHRLETIRHSDMILLVEPGGKLSTRDPSDVDWAALTGNT